MDRAMGNIVDTVENTIQNAILTAIDRPITLKLELVFESIKSCSRQDATSVMAISERRNIY